MPRRNHGEHLRRPYRPQSDEKYNACGCYSSYAHPEGKCWREWSSSKPTTDDDTAPWIARELARTDESERKIRLRLGLPDPKPRSDDHKSSKPARRRSADRRRRIA